MVFCLNVPQTRGLSHSGIFNAMCKRALIKDLYIYFPDIQSHELYLEDPQNDNNLPLFSQFCCRLAAMPYCCEEEVLAGNVKLRKELKMQSFWAVLMGWKMSLWTDKSLKDAARSAYAEIQVNRDTRIEDKGNQTTKHKKKASELYLSVYKGPFSPSIEFFVVMHEFFDEA